MKLLTILFVFLVLCAVLALGIGFAAVNRTPVPLDLLVVSFGEHSVALWVVAALATGGVLGMMTSIGLVVRLRTKLMRANRKLRNLEKAQQKDSGKAAAGTAPVTPAATSPEAAVLEAPPQAAAAADK